MSKLGESRVIAKTRIGFHEVSTVYLGWKVESSGLPPYETMVFKMDSMGTTLHAVPTEGPWRATTWSEAEAFGDHGRALQVAMDAEDNDWIVKNPPDPDKAISMQRLESILYREDAVIDPDDIPALMLAIRAEAE